MVHSLVAGLAWMGRCAAAVLCMIPRSIRLCGRLFIIFCKDFLHGCRRILRLIRRILHKPVQLTSETAKAAQSEWRSSAGQGKAARCISLLKMSGTVLLSEHGILSSLFRFAVPLLCCAFLFSVVSYGTDLEYDIAVTFNNQPLGYIESEADYLAAVQIVQQRLSYTDEEYEMSFQRKLRLEINSGGTQLLTVGELADKMLESADISLCSGYGVYVGGEFVGAVEDPEPIKAALAKQLSTYSDFLDGEADELYYADTVTYEKGTYLADNLTDAKTLARRLTSKTDTTRTYFARENDTIYSVADRFTTTVERILELNPDLSMDSPLIAAYTRVTVPITTRYLPIIYTKTVSAVSFIDYETVKVETNMLPVGTEEIITEGVKGEKQNTVQVTYTDGAESSRVILSSRLISEPISEEIGVGTYTAQPASTSTQLAGSGRFAWPLNGGRISDVFISNRNHRGLDIAAPGGTEIYAAADGTVRTAGLSSSYGYYIIIDHGDGYETLYAHSSLLLVSEGQTVRRGQTIALVGTTGHSTGNHLHFEVRVNGINFDPASFLRVNVD